MIFRARFMPMLAFLALFAAACRIHIVLFVSSIA